MSGGIINMSAIIKKDTKQCVFYSPNYFLTFGDDGERIYINHPDGSRQITDWFVENHEYHQVTSPFNDPPFTDYMYIDGQWVKKQ